VGYSQAATCWFGARQRRQAARSAAASGARMPTAWSPRSHGPGAGSHQLRPHVMGTTMYLREHHFPNVYAGVVHW